ncbi:type-F conjugative transfer system protein TraW [Xenophilus azovorans]|uniref:type-F conjugative transfer system protein TraW n=1 Tax=Xenophilus azovorans TaxID=151755 RepID=UPI000A05D28C|nr:type-F conjugative transfer system protein TraW [Xenophilus azovorans]
MKLALCTFPAAPASLVLLAALASADALATDLGTLGPTYEITEPHLLQMIEQRLRAKERSGELARIEQEARQRGTDTVRHPPALANVRTTQAARTFFYDPTYTLDRNILGAQGELLFAAGTQANPLDVVSLSRHLLFFDARDARQVLRARELMAHYQGRVKPILTGGSYLDLMKSWRMPVYYDQQGLLTRRLGITQVPALVSQDGRRLRIDEMEVPR